MTCSIVKGSRNGQVVPEQLELVDVLPRNPTGKVLTSAGVTDGPLVESKEIVGGYSVVLAKTYEDALKVAGECPIHAGGAH